MKDVMIDLETLSTEPNACVLSIGACFFDIKTGDIGAEFHKHIDVGGRNDNVHISADTVLWWLKQPEAARAAITQAKSVTLLAQALTDLFIFISKTKQPTVWSNGASFDLVILRTHYKRWGISAPWQYWQERDTRTLVDIAKRITGTDASNTVRVAGDIKHDALADAIHQAQYISTAYRLLEAAKA